MRLISHLQEAKQKQSAAVLLTNGVEFLIVHPSFWPGNRWDLPKGGVDQGEKPKDTAAREFYEEVGIKISKGKLKPLNKFMYHNGQIMNVFSYFVHELPPTATMHCPSTFNPRRKYTKQHGKDVGKVYPEEATEIAEYQYVDFKNYKKKLAKEWHPTIEKLKKRLDI